MKKLSAVLVIALAITGCQSCASFGSVKEKAARPYFVAHIVLRTVSESEPRLVCGRPTAAPYPACVEIGLHHSINAKIEEAGKIDFKINGLIKDLPDTALTPASALALLPDLWALIDEILSGLPEGQTKTQLTKLAGVK